MSTLKAGWKMVALGEVAEQIRGVSYNKNAVSDVPLAGSIPILRATNITENGINLQKILFIQKNIVSKKKLLKKGDILVVASSGSVDIVGRSSFIDRENLGTFGAFCKVLRPCGDLHCKYFSFFLRTEYYRSKISSLSSGANINNLRNEHLDNFQIPLPPLEEQRRIATILDQADALRLKHEESLVQLEALLQVLSHRIFDKEAAEKKWPKVALGEVAEIVSGATPKTSIKEYWDGSILWVTPKDLSALNGKIIENTERKITYAGLGSCSAHILPPESVLFSSRASIGHVAVNKIPMATNQGFKSMIPDRNTLDYNYLYYWLGMNRSYLKSLGNGATFKEVSKAVISRVEIPLPPLEEQRRIASCLDAVEVQRGRHRQALMVQKELFTTLQHRAFCGEM